MRHTVFLVRKVNQEVILVSYEFCEICRNAFFAEHLRATASFKIAQNSFTHHFLQTSTSETTPLQQQLM